MKQCTRCYHMFYETAHCFDGICCPCCGHNQTKEVDENSQKKNRGEIGW